MTRRERGLFGTYSVDDAVLNKGGVGSIHRTSDPSFVYKRYFSPQKAPLRKHLDWLIEVGRDVLINQGKQPGNTPESSVNWPVDVVVGDSGVVNGVVLPRIPSALFSAELGTVRTLDFLVMARAYPPSAKGRVALLLRMAEILAFVNARGLVHGDINSKNLAWALHPNPVMYLIDCDGMLPQSPPPTTGVGATGWMDPRVMDRMVPAHDRYSDWYCLALAMYRGLLLTPGRLDKTSDGHWPEPSKIPPEMHPEVAHLIRRALSNPLDSPQQRPAPQEWVDVLVGAYLPNRRFDEDALTALDTLSAPKPIPHSNFVSLPPTNWDSQPRSTGPPLTPGRQLPIAPPQSTRQPLPSYPSPPGTPQPHVAVVFIHGLFSSPQTWEHFNKIIASDSDLAELATLHFHYASPKFNLNPLRCIPDYNVLADSFKTFLEVDAIRYQKLVLVSHSQGGLIIQRFLQRMLNNGRGLELARIRRIVMFACPNSGSELLMTVRRGLAFWRHPQERDLRPINASVTEAQKTVLNQVVHADGLAPHQCRIAIHAYAGDQDNIVTPTSAQNVFPDNGVVPGDHASIIKPNSANHRSYTTLRSHLMPLIGERGKYSTTPPKRERVPAVEMTQVEDEPIVVRWNPNSRNLDFVMNVDNAVSLIRKLTQDRRDHDET